MEKVTIIFAGGPWNGTKKEIPLLQESYKMHDPSEDMPVYVESIVLTHECSIWMLDQADPVLAVQELVDSLPKQEEG